MAGGKKAQKSDLTKLKDCLKSINKQYDDIITKMGQTGDGKAGKKTLVGRIELLNEDFHDSDSVTKAYNNVNKALADLEKLMKTSDDYMKIMQGYYDVVKKAKKK